MRDVEHVLHNPLDIKRVCEFCIGGKVVSTSYFQDCCRNQAYSLVKLQERI